MTQLATLLAQICKPSLKHKPLMTLINHCVNGHCHQLGEELSQALLEVLPPESGAEIWDPLMRCGTRMGYGITRFVFPNRHAGTDRFLMLRRFSRLIDYVRAALDRQQAIGHLQFVKVLRERIAAYAHLVNAVREISDRPDPNPGVLGCLVERTIIAGTSTMTLTAAIAASLLRDSDPTTRSRFRQRFEATIPIGMSNPYEPVFSDENRQSGADILWDALSKAGTGSLTSLLAKVHFGTLIRADEATPQFSKPLVANAHFQNAAKRLPAHFCEFLKN